jgi:radical SAM protein (TIGR01212 family)
VNFNWHGDVTAMALYWGEKRYYSLDYFLKQSYGEKLYKISLNGGMTCPNRDGTLGKRGCIFCSRGGSGDFAADASFTISKQIEEGKKLVQRKQTGNAYIAYFQAYTNTYAPLPYLRKIFTEAIMHPDVRILSIATRPDCLGREVIRLLDELNHVKPVWVELGLQTMHDSTAGFLRRGYTLPVFEEAVAKLRKCGISVITHTILGLPGEDERMILDTIYYLNRIDIQGVKLQLLHILKDTDLAGYYKLHPFHILSMEEYFSLLGLCISNLRQDIVIHRLTGDGPKDLLIAPVWSGNKRFVLNQLNSYFKRHDIWQGKEL